MIAFNNLTYTYPQSNYPIIANLNLQIEEGEFLLVIGDSGSGKSTFLRLLDGLIPHFYGGTFLGKAVIFGENTKQHSVASLSKLVGFVFQDVSSQFVTAKVEDELVFYLENLEIEPKTICKRIEEVLDQLGIVDLRKRRIDSLSGGEKQKVAIGAALATRPRVLVLDEPTSELDPNSAEEVLTILQKLNHDLAITIVLSEHRLERVVNYADRLLEIKRKSSQGPAIFNIGKPRDVLEQTNINPPLVKLAKKMNLRPLPLTLKEAKKQFSQEVINLRNIRPTATKAEGEQIVAKLQNLSYAYEDRTALRDINLDIKEQEIIAVMGRNGSGKTTLVKHLCGLLRPQKGKVEVLGVETNTFTGKVIPQVGYLPQRPNALLFKETVSEEIEFTLEINDLSQKEADVFLKKFDLSGVENHYPRDLSLGEQQRVALGAVMAAEPKIIILDEPTHGLDYQNKEGLVSLLKQLKSDGKTVVLVTHDVELVAQIAQRVVLLAEGQVVVDGGMREVLSESMLFSPQLNKLLGGQVMSLEDVKDALK